MANYFDQFDSAEAPKSNPFDKFDNNDAAPKRGGNYFDQFDLADGAEPEDQPAVDMVEEKGFLDKAKDFVSSAAESTPRVLGSAAQKVVTGLGQLPGDIRSAQEYGMSKVFDAVGQEDLAKDARLNAELYQAGNKQIADKIKEASPDEINNLTPTEDIASSVTALVVSGTGGAAGAGRGFLKSLAGSVLGEAATTGSETNLDTLVLGDGETPQVVKNRLLMPAESAALGTILGAAIGLGKYGYQWAKSKFATEAPKVAEDVLAVDAMANGTGRTEAQAKAAEEVRVLDQADATADAGKSIDPTLDAKTRVYAKWFDKLTPIRVWESRLKGISPKFREDTPMTADLQVTIQRGPSITRSLFSEGIPVETADGGLDIMQGTKGISQIFEDIKAAGGTVEDAVKYKAYRRIAKDYELTQEGKRAGIALPIDEVRTYLASVENEPWAQVAQKEFSNYFRSSLDFAKAGGTLDDFQIENLMRTYGDDYFPVMRDPKVTDRPLFSRSGTSKGSGFAAAKGGELPYADFTAGLTTYVTRLGGAVHRNMVLNKMIDVAEGLDNEAWNKVFKTSKEQYQLQQQGFSSAKAEKIYKSKLDDLAEEGIIDDVGQGADGVDYVSKEGTLTFFKNGKRISLDVSDPDFMDTLNALGYDEMGTIRKTLAATRNIYRGAITYNPAFMLANLAMDSLASGITSRTKMLPFVGTVQGFYRMYKNPELWAQYLRDTGGGTSYANFAAARSQDDVDKIIKELQKEYKGGFLQSAKRGLENVSTRGENVVRFEEYARTLEQGGRRGLASNRSGEVTVNFWQGGSGETNRYINSMGLFFNATLVSTDRSLRAIGRNPGKVASAGLGTITVPTLIQYALAAQHPEYYNIPADVRHRNWILFTGPNIEDRVQFPLDRVFSPFFAGIPMAMLDDYVQKTGSAQTVQQLIASMRNMVGIPNATPPLLQGAWDISTNKDYRGMNIIPESMKDNPPVEQYDERTKATYRAIGELTNQSPMQIDYLASQFLGQFEELATSFVTDPIMRKVMDLPEKPDVSLGRTPILSRFFGNESRDSTLRVYTIASQLEGLSAKYDEYVQNTESTDPRRNARADTFIQENNDLIEFLPYLRSTMEEMSSFSKRMREVQVDPELSGEDKKKALDQLYIDRDQIAKNFLEDVKTSDKFRQFYSQSFGKSPEAFIGKFLMGKAPETYTKETDAVKSSINKLMNENYDEEEEMLDSVPPTNTAKPAIYQAGPDRRALEDSLMEVAPGFLEEDYDAALARNRKPLGRPVAEPQKRPEPTAWETFTGSDPDSKVVDKIDYDFIEKLEGGNRLVAYIPKQGGKAIGQSGVTVGRGVDLGQQQLDSLDIPDSLRTKLRPYEGLKKDAAIKKLREKPLTLTQKETEILNKAVGQTIMDQLADKFDTFSKVSFDSLDTAKRTALASLAYQYGPNLDQRASKVFGAAVKGEWDQVVQHLRNFQDRYTSRRNKEADLLEDSLNS